MSSTAASSSANGSNSATGTDTKVVDEIPESLNQILLMIVKNFFSNEHYLAVYYIMRAECIREENLKARINFDQKQLRQLLATLKAEKLVKERLFQEKKENGRSTTLNFYFINYRSVLNVLKYKIDHMRQKLESREKNDTNKAHYKCNNCKSTYDMLEINGILDMVTQRLTCWRCHGEVEADESVAPSQLTRTAVARFNEQMTPLFSRIQELNGIQLAPHLLEPDISKYLEDDRARELQLQQQSMDFTSSGTRVALGATAHSYHSAATLNYQHGDTITVDLNADINNRPVEEAKVMPLWLQDSAIGGGNDDLSHNEQVLNQVNEVATETHNTGLSIDLLAEFEGVSNEPPAKKSKVEEEEKKEEDEEEEEEEEEELEVGGRKVAFSEITEKMIEFEMTDDERQKYTELVQQFHVY